MTTSAETGLAGRTAELQIGVVIRKQPGVTRWARWIWRPVAVLPGAGPAVWHEMRRDGEAVEYHAATVTMEVHRKETEGYRVALSNDPPSVYVILRPCEEPDAPHEMEVFRVTASAFEAQDYLDSGEEVVEPIPMPPELIAWLSAFVEMHHEDEVFKKRKRRNWDEGIEDGERGDVRVTGDDVFRAPTARKMIH
ncbi:MAG: DUF3305 domain-containing protein [Paracoccaceae bacterium]